MQRRRAAFVAALVVGSVLGAMAPTNPAAATTPTVCTGFGSSVVSPGLFYPIGSPQITTTGTQTTVLFHNTHRVASWNFALDPLATCTNGGFVTASGSLQGYCGHSTGTGVTSSGHLIQWFSLGGYMWFTNGIIGGAYYTPDTLSGHSCVQSSLGSPGASQFIWTLAWIPTNCPAQFDTLFTPLSTGLTSQFFPLTFSILDPFTGLWHITFSVPHFHWNLHHCLFWTFLK